jgi:hypothetical protein
MCNHPIKIRFGPSKKCANLFSHHHHRRHRNTIVTNVRTLSVVVARVMDVQGNVVLKYAQHVYKIAGNVPNNFVSLVWREQSLERISRSLYTTGATMKKTEIWMFSQVQLIYIVCCVQNVAKTTQENSSLHE